MDELSQPLKDRKFVRDFLIFAAILSLLVGLCVLIYFIIKVSESHSIPDKNEYLHLTSFGAFGDFIAGVVGTLFSLAGFFLLYLTFKEQRENFNRERLESNFFEMVKFHRDNVNELKYTYHDPKENNQKDHRVTAERRKVFKIIFVQFKEAFTELKHLFFDTSIENIYHDEYLNKLKANSVLTNRKIDFKQYAQIDMIYLIVFFGVGKEDQQTLFNIFKNKYNEKFIKKILDFAALKPKKESKYYTVWELISKLEERKKTFESILLRRIDKNYPSVLLDDKILRHRNEEEPLRPFYEDDYIKYYGGHQFRLGHYYRQFYQSVTFIDKEKYLSYKDKYDYIKILRGQLSNYEQIVFFLNSISQIGRTWELEKKNKPEKSISENKQLFTKYNLIKNIPNDVIAEDIKLLDYYPYINYEAIQNIDGREKRKELEIKYS